MICPIFHFAYKIQPNFTIWNGVETLEIHQFLMVWHEHYTQARVSEGEQVFDNFSIKGCFLSFEW